MVRSTVILTLVLIAILINIYNNSQPRSPDVYVDVASRCRLFGLLEL